MSTEDEDDEDNEDATFDRDSLLGPSFTSPSPLEAVSFFFQYVASEAASVLLCSLCMPLQSMMSRRIDKWKMRGKWVMCQSSVTPDSIVCSSELVAFEHLKLHYKIESSKSYLNCMWSLQAADKDVDGEWYELMELHCLW